MKNTSSDHSSLTHYFHLITRILSHFQQGLVRLALIPGGINPGDQILYKLSLPSWWE
jgi:hypothetical protein